MADRFQDIPGYEMISELGEGGMATVYLAIQHSLDRKVAIKVMRRELRTGSGPMPEFERRFLLEGRTMAKLPHRNIVAVYDIVTRDDIAYISMELLEGGTLSERMRAGLSLGESIGIVVQIANGLEFAHRNGVIHRDLKPSNVMFRDAATPVLTDFGIAKQSDVLASRITQTGMVLGTPTYMSPEQASGKDIDGRADQYALGILFYEMLTGRPPFTGDNPMVVLMGHALQPPPPLPEDLKALQPIFDRLLAKDPNNRFPNLQDFVRALRGLVVNNDALVRQLGNVATANTSERLRALGFSGDYTGGDSGFALDLLRMPTTDPALRPHTTSVMMQVIQRPRMLALIAAGLGAIILSVVLWIVFRPHTLSADDQYLVRTLLREADRLVESGDLLAPPGANAFEDLQKVLQKDPENQQGLELMGRIAALLRDEAEKALAAGQLDTAMEKANQALLVVPEDADATALLQRIDAATRQRATAAEVSELVAKADAAMARKSISGADGAYALLRKALALDPDNAKLQARLKALADAEFATVRSLIDTGKLDAASVALESLRTDFGSDPGFAAMNKALAEKRQTMADAERLAGLISRGNTALSRGRISEPPGDNAFDWYEQARQIAADDAAVVAFRNALTARILTDARSAQGRKDMTTALDRAELALRIDPDLADANAIRTAAQQALGARQAGIASQLNLARASIAAGRLLPPAKDNAFDVINALLREDPGNADAGKLRDALPSVVADALRNAVERGDLLYAGTLADSAATVYPDDRRISGLIGNVRERQTEQRKSAELAASMARITERLGKRPLTRADAESVATAIVALRDADRASAERFEQQLLAGLEDDIRAAKDPEAGGERLAAVRAAAAVIKSNTALTRLAGTAELRVAELEQQRQTELAAQTGELFINALPWGTVETVLDAQRKPVELPADRTTPLRLNLPAGSYYVTLRHPGSRTAVSVFARVSAGKRSDVSGSFPTLSAEEYLNRAAL